MDYDILVYLILRDLANIAIKIVGSMEETTTMRSVKKRETLKEMLIRVNQEGELDDNANLAKSHWKELKNRMVRDSRVGKDTLEWSPSFTRGQEERAQVKALDFVVKKLKNKQILFRDNRDFLVIILPKEDISSPPPPPLPLQLPLSTDEDVITDALLESQFHSKFQHDSSLTTIEKDETIDLQ